MTAAKIFDKYAEALVDCGLGDDAPLSADAVFLALRLAIGDAWQESRPAVPDQRQAEVDRQQIAIIAEWLEENEPALYHSYAGGGYGELALQAIDRRDRQIDGLQSEIAKVDADNAGITEDLSVARSELALLIAERDVLRRELSEAQQGWAAAQADADRMALHVAQMPSFIHTNGNGADPGRIERDWRSALSATVAEFVESLDTGRRAFRSVPKAVRLEILQAIMRSITDDGMPSRISYDAARPSWAPQSSGIPTTFGCSWFDLLTLDPAAEAV